MNFTGQGYSSCILSFVLFLNWAGRNSLSKGKMPDWPYSLRVSMALLYYLLTISSALSHALIPWSSQANRYKYSFYPRTVVDWTALPAPKCSKLIIDSQPSSRLTAPTEPHGCTLGLGCSVWRWQQGLEKIC